MSDDAALLGAIRANSDEDTPRLAFADWLLEHDRPERAEFIRAQVELARLPDDDPRCADLEVTERRLLAKNVAEWAAPWPAFRNGESVGDGPQRAIFRRGFLDTVQMFEPFESPGADSLAELCARHPIRIAMSGSAPDLSAQLDWPWWNRVETLTLFVGPNTSISAAQAYECLHSAETFLREAPLAGLRKLVISAGCGSEHDVARWLRLPVVRRLGSLSLFACARNAPSGETVLELVTGDFPNLRELHLGAEPAPAYLRALDRFAESDTWRRLTRFGVTGPFPWDRALADARLERLELYVPFEPYEAQEFANAVLAAGDTPLHELTLCGRGVNYEELAPVLEACALSNLRCLDFSDVGLTTATVNRLANAPFLGRLNRLTIPAANEGLEALFAVPLNQLTHLHVDGIVTAEAVCALARNESCRRLRELMLGHLRTPNALDALSDGAVFPELHTVGFECSRPDRALIERFVNSDKLPRLCVVPFSVGWDHVGSLVSAFRQCERIAWAGGTMSDDDDGVRITVVPGNVYLPSHLDDSMLE